MLALAAHLALHGRHHHTVIVGGLHWRYCGHRSHRLRLRCWRWFNSDGYCARHNRTCWGSCGPNDYDYLTEAMAPLTDDEAAALGEKMRTGRVARRKARLVEGNTDA